MDCRLMTEGGLVSSSTWQAAAVRRPLLAVPACNDKGNLVVFDNEGSCILSSAAEEVAQIRQLIAQATKKIRLQRKGGIYTMRTWRVPDKVEPKSGFTRQGP